MKYTHFVVATFVSLAVASVGHAELPPFGKVSEGYTKFNVSDQQATKGLFNLWKRDKDSQLLGELPKNFAGKSYFIALTVSSGDRYAGWRTRYRDSRRS